MKKLILSLIAILSVSLLSSAQTSLHRTYMSLKDIPGMKVKDSQTIQVNGIADINGARTATVKSNDHAERLKGDFLNNINEIPSSDMVANADNTHEFARIFAEPGDHNFYNVLVVQGDAISGIFTATYGTATAEDVEAIRSGLSSNGAELVLTTVSPTSGTLITMTE